MRIILDIPFSIPKICSIVGAKAPRGTSAGAIVNAICTDTRDCRSGDLFVALDGENGSGENYVKDAIGKNAAVISVAYSEDVIHVNDTVDALLKLAKAYKSEISPKYTVAVTGSVGKSTTVRLIESILKTRYKTHSTIGNFNNHIGVPLTLFAMPRYTEILITELGMNHKGEISRLSGTVNPDLGIITSVGTAHVGNLGSRENIAEAKLEILDGMNPGRVLLPASEPLLDQITEGIYVGRNSSLSDYSLDNGPGGALSFRAKDKAITNIKFFSGEEHLLYDLAYAISVAKILGLTDEEIIMGTASITDSILRQRFIVLKDFTIFDDSYNASLESVRADLKFISGMQRPKGAFLGDILELGESTKTIHEQIGRSAADLGIDRLYLLGSYAEYIANGAIRGGMPRKSIFVNTDILSPKTSIQHILENHLKNEIILFKASHRLRFDKIADMIKSEEK